MTEVSPAGHRPGVISPPARQVQIPREDHVSLSNRSEGRAGCHSSVVDTRVGYNNEQCSCTPPSVQLFSADHEPLVCSTDNNSRVGCSGQARPYACSPAACNPSSVNLFFASSRAEATSAASLSRSIATSTSSPKRLFFGRAPATALAFPALQHALTIVIESTLAGASNEEGGFAPLGSEHQLTAQLKLLMCGLSRNKHACARRSCPVNHLVELLQSPRSQPHQPRPAVGATGELLQIPLTNRFAKVLHGRLSTYTLHERVSLRHGYRCLVPQP